MNTLSDTPANLPASAPARARPTRSIGDILIAAGRLTPQDLERILHRQRHDKSQFGDAALALNLLTREDIDFALSQQFDYAYLPEQDTSRSAELVAAFKPFSRVGENLRALRSQLVLRWFKEDPAHKVLAMVSANNGEGRSFISANLAIVFAQQGQRTLLIDGDLRTPRQHALFGLGRSAGLSGILAERAALQDAALDVRGLSGLTVLPAGFVPPNPQELLGRQAFATLLNAAVTEFDVVIIDTPAGAESADAEIISARAGAAVIVTRKNYSAISATTILAKRLHDAGVVLVGSVLNDG